jgi:uncharacterized membrane protein
MGVFMKSFIPKDLTFSEVGHLQIVKAFANKIKLVETFDTMVNSQMELPAGACILAMVLDTLSGRTPLYRLEEFFQEKDTELLLGNLTALQDYSDWSAKALLVLYKDQSGIEQNFSFLKDPVIVNSIFLKKPQRIEVLGLVLLIALLIWRLMERCMRKYIETTGTQITGWKKKQTKRPTSFMMTTKFLSILVVKSGNRRQLARPLRPVQKEFLLALNVTPDIFTIP